ncbi:HNH endonuclease [Plesiomonas shigelloides]|uniref:HNH endonuclease n=1 Tax=Plesiomonas shigelloides TaxID=703 RepID=UPI00326145CE
MIKLQRAVKPSYLTDEKVHELTNEFKLSGSSVWNHDKIKTPLLESSFNKCAYCQCPLSTESNYMEVEHFEDKKHNPDKVVDWDNLLPSCKKCNGSKGNHDVVSEPILNPYIDDPREHLYMRLYRFRGKTPKGTTTIDVTNLNHSTRLVFSRYEIGEKIDGLLETAWERFETFKANKTTVNRNKFVRIIEGLLIECQPYSDYSASTATNLFTDSKFVALVSEMKNESIWTQELDVLFKNASTLVLDCA